MNDIVSRAVGIAVLTVSDTRNAETDTSGKLLIDRLQAAGHRLVDRQLVPDEAARIAPIIQRWMSDPTVEVVLATGGTGIAGRDLTVEVFESLFEKHIPGFGELFRMLSYEEIGTSTINSRTTAGLAQGTLLFALPGSTGACATAWDRILCEQLDVNHRPCNLIALLPQPPER